MPSIDNTHADECCLEMLPDHILSKIFQNYPPRDLATGMRPPLVHSASPSFHQTPLNNPPFSPLAMTHSVPRQSRVLPPRQRQLPLAKPLLHPLPRHCPSSGSSQSTLVETEYFMEAKIRTFPLRRLLSCPSSQP